MAIACTSCKVPRISVAIIVAGWRRARSEGDDQALNNDRCVADGRGSDGDSFTTEPSRLMTGQRKPEKWSHGITRMGTEKYGWEWESKGLWERCFLRMARLDYG